MLEKNLKYRTSFIQRVTQCKKILPKNDKLQTTQLKEQRRNFKDCWKNEVGTGKQVTWISYVG